MTGQITRKDIIEDDALSWGPEYGKQLEIAINKNKEFVAGIVAINNALIELRKVKDYKDLTDSVTKTNQAVDQSIIALKEQKRVEGELIKIKERHKNVNSDQNKELVRERVLLAEVNKQVKKEVLDRLGLTSAYTKLNAARTESKNKLRDLMSVENAARADIKKAQREFEILDRRVRRADAAVGDFTKNVGNYPFKSMVSNVKNLIGAFGITTGVAAIGTVISDAITKIKAFDQSIADLASITGATGKDLEYLRSQAILMGRDTKGGAVAVSEAFKLIAGAKPELLENVEALNAVTKSVLLLAKASGMEMPAAATALTDAMNQFGADASQAAIFVDALASGAKYGSAEIPELTESLLKFGAVARSSNVSIHESTALVELLGENGLKGAEAGTALRNVLLKLSATDALPKKAVAELAALGVNMEDLGDKSLPIQQRLEALKPLLKDNASIVKVFGLENATAAINVLEHTDRLKELTGQMGEVGTASEQAAIRTNTLGGAWERLMSTYDSFILSLDTGDGIFTRAMKDTVSKVTLLFELGRRAVTSSEKLKEEQLAQIRQKGIDDAIKSYSDKAKFDDQYLKNVQASNAQEVLSNNDKIIALKEQNKLIEADRTISGYKQKKMLNANIEMMKEYNKKSRALNANTAGIESLLASRKGGAVTTDPSSDDGGDAAKKLTDKQIAEAKRAARARYDIAKKAADDEFKLRQFRMQVAIEVENEITANEKLSYDDRLDAFLDAQKLIEEKTREAAARELQLLGSYNDERGVFVRELTDAEIKAVLDGSKKKESLTAEQVLIYEKYQNALTQASTKGEDDRRKLTDGQVGVLQKEIDKQLLAKDTELKKELALENDRFKDELALAGDNQVKIEKATEAHEQRLFEIKKRYAIEALKLQADGFQQQLEDNDKKVASEQISTDERAKLINKLATYRAEIGDLENQQYQKKTDEKADIETRFNERVKELAWEMKDALVDLTNAIFDARISNLDFEIQKSNEYYDNEIEKAGDDARKKEMLEAEKSKKQEALEKKKRKMEYQAAVFNKIMSLATLATQTALASMAALAPPPIGLGPVAGSALLPYIFSVAALQAATIIATPLPKYKGGRKGGPEEWAVTGDGFRSEVISRPDGSSAVTTPAKPTLTFLKKDDIVHKSMADYKQFMNNKLLNDIRRDNQSLSGYQSSGSITLDNSDVVKELQEVKKAIARIKLSPPPPPREEINQQLWKTTILNWR